jgi:acetylglutamate kinase
VLGYGGDAMAKDALLASFARDINLLRSAGLSPIVVHGGDRELRHEKAPRNEIPKDRPSSRTIEMILTGRVNTELVSLLNHASAHAESDEGKREGQASAIGLSGKDAGLFRAKRGGTSPTAINTDVLEMMLPKYVPVLSPVALGDDGESVLLDADSVAAEVAVALHADKLIYLTDAPGLLESGELVPEITANEARARLDAGTIPEGIRSKITAGLRALEGGTRSVHIIDGRVPHSVIAELFTDTGVGTLLKRE